MVDAVTRSEVKTSAERPAAPAPTETSAVPQDVRVETPAAEPAEKLSPVMRWLRRYTGPADGLSHPSHRQTWRTVNNMLLPLLFRKNVQGAEKLPLQGGQVYCYDHPSTNEPLFVSQLVDRDLRSIAVDAIFVGPLGPLVTSAGAFPVNRDNPSRVTVRHCVDILKQGLGLSISPAAGAQPNQLVVPPLHRGAAGFAVMGKAENLVPITFFYHPDHEARPTEKAMGYAAAAVVTAAGLAVAALGAPVVAATAGAVLAGGYAAGYVADKVIEPKNPIARAVAKFGANLVAGLTGAVAAGLATATALAAAPMAAPILLVAGGLGVLGLAHAWRTRDIAEIVVSDPLPVAQYTQKFGAKAAITQLTEDLHRSMGQAKAELTGVPYDESAPKIVDSQHTNDPHPIGCPV